MAVSKKRQSELEEQKLLGKQIRAVRDRLKLTRNQVADVLDTNELMVKRLESGSAVLTVPRLFKLAEAFQLEPSDLLRDFSSWEAREGSGSLSDLSEEERRLLRAWHRITDRVQKRNVLALLERMTERDGS